MDRCTCDCTCLGVWTATIFERKEFFHFLPSAVVYYDNSSNNFVAEDLSIVISIYHFLPLSFTGVVVHLSNFVIFAQILLLNCALNVII